MRLAIVLAIMIYVRFGLCKTIPTNEGIAIAIIASILFIMDIIDLIIKRGREEN